MILRARGKHARPSKTAPVVVAGGMTATFFLADASPASAAAPDSEWDRLAQCESGGNWSINTGNGYYGGLQFNLATWQSVGGKGRPDQNSRAEQIKRANILHDSRGFQPWPSCSRKLGLRGGSAGPAQDSAESTTSSATQEVAEEVQAAAPRAERASRSTRRAAAPKAAPPPVTGKYQASRRARVVVALATTTPPVFDGHVLSTADVSTYRIAVKHWQRRMAARGWILTVDGHFGPQSASVAKRFAEQKGLQVAVPGTVDKAVWDAAWQLEVS